MAPDDASRSLPSRPPISPLREGEVDDFFDVDAAAFGARMPKGFEDLVRSVMTLDRVAAARDDGALVGTAASEAYEP